MPSDAEYPRYFDVLCAAVMTLWILVSFGLCVLFIFEESRTLVEAIATSIFILVLGGTATFILGGLISFPIWWIFKRFYLLTRNIAACVGAITGAFLSTIIIFALPADYAGTTIGATSTGMITLLTMTLLGALAGWNGYRVALNGLRRRRVPRT